MTVKRNVQRALRRMLCSRTGTAEIIGSVMFLLIMMFFFTNVFLWHDRATREMDSVLSDKMNSLVNVEWKNESDTIPPSQQPNYRGTLYVSNNGGAVANLSRLWVIKSALQQDTHTHLDLEGEDLLAAAGSSVQLELFYSGQSSVEKLGPQTVKVNYPWAGETTFKILTTRGNMAACTYDFAGWQ
jgi:hypothetical protein